MQLLCTLLLNCTNNITLDLYRPSGFQSYKSETSLLINIADIGHDFEPSLP